MAFSSSLDIVSQTFSSMYPRQMYFMAPLISEDRHSRMLLAGIQANLTGPPIKTFGGDGPRIFIFAFSNLLPILLFLRLYPFALALLLLSQLERELGAEVLGFKDPANLDLGVVEM